MKSTRPKRPLLRWHGGKFRIASWVVSHFREHRVYVEPFGGAGSVLLTKPRSYAEVWNDIDDQVYNLFWVMRHHARDLTESLRLTPYSRREMEMAYTDHPDPVERARRLIVRSFQGFGGDSASAGKGMTTGFRSNSNRSNTTPAHDWVNYEQHLLRLADRMRGIVIENRDAFEVMRQHDSKDTLFYLDPPYMHGTRKRVGSYRHEMSDLDHEGLLDFATCLDGHVVISSYENELYDRKLAGWKKLTREARADGARERIEVLWVK